MLESDKQCGTLINSWIKTINHFFKNENQQKDMLIVALHPRIFRKHDDIKTFINRCNKYFDALRTHKSVRSLIVIWLINKNLRDKYEATENHKGNSQVEKMRKSFTGL